MPVRIVEVEGEGAVVIGHEVCGYQSAMVVDQAEAGEAFQELKEGLRPDPKRDEVEAGCFSLALRRAREQRELCVAAVRGDHQGLSDQCP